MKDFIENITNSINELKNVYQKHELELKEIEALALQLLPDSLKNRHKELLNGTKIIDGATQAYNQSIKKCQELSEKPDEKVIEEVNKT